jgi:hypothetical protein
MFKTNKLLYLSVVAFTILALSNPLITYAQNLNQYTNQFSFPQYSIGTNQSAMSFNNYNNTAPQSFTMPAFSIEQSTNTVHYGNNYSWNYNNNNTGLTYNNVGNSIVGSFNGIEPLQQFQAPGNASFFAGQPYTAGYSMAINNSGTDLFQFGTMPSFNNIGQELPWQPVQSTGSALFPTIQPVNSSYSMDSPSFNVLDLKGLFDFKKEYTPGENTQILVPQVNDSTDIMDIPDFGIKEMNMKQYSGDDTDLRHSH